MGATVERQGLDETPDADDDCSSGVSEFQQISSTSSSTWLSYFYFKTPTAEVEPGGLWCQLVSFIWWTNRPIALFIFFLIY